MNGQTAKERLVGRVHARLFRTIALRYGGTNAQALVLAERAVDAMLSFDGLMAVAEQWLDEHYTADVPLVCDRDSDDPGPRLAAALRDCLEARS
ncbi:MAG: hypothetical protein ACRDK4_05170 [Solirubrobacteraceae bacterium]